MSAPSELEVAAVVAALAVLAAERAPAEPRPRSAWADPARAVRRPLRPGPDAWRRS